MHSDPERDRRSATEVFQAHLRFGLAGNVEDDLAQNYAEDVVVPPGWGIERGHDGIRALSRCLQRLLPDGMFRYGTQLVDGELAFLEWTATSVVGQVRGGADSFVIRDGRIVAQTTHYTIEPFGRPISASEPTPA